MLYFRRKDELDSILKAFKKNDRSYPLLHHYFDSVVTFTFPKIIDIKYLWLGDEYVVSFSFEKYTPPRIIYSTMLEINGLKRYVKLVVPYVMNKTGSIVWNKKKAFVTF